jgi:hypothetical protein
MPARREPQSTTFSTTAGQSIAKGRPERHGWGLTGALLAGIGLVALAIVVVWRSGWIGDATGDEPSRPVLATPPRPPPPIVEPIIEEPRPPPGGSAADPTVAPTTDHAVAPATDHAITPATDPTLAPATDPTLAPATDHALVSPTDRKKRRPHRPPVHGAPHAGSGTGSGSGASAGSAEPPEDDDKWMHMTHDEKKP